MSATRERQTAAGSRSLAHIHVARAELRLVLTAPLFFHRELPKVLCCRSVALPHYATMKISSGNVPVYTISGSEARPLPEWLIRKRKRSLKNDPEFANRVDLLQDFEFEEASQCVRVSEDGDWVMSTGTYKPQIHVHYLPHLSLSFARHTNTLVRSFRSYHPPAIYTNFRRTKPSTSSPPTLPRAYTSSKIDASSSTPVGASTMRVAYHVTVAISSTTGDQQSAWYPQSVSTRTAWARPSD